MKLKGSLKGNRIWIVKEFQDCLQSNFCKITIIQNKKRVTFISKLSKDKRLVIPKEYKNNLKDGLIQINFTTIENNDRNTSLIKNGKIDILSLIPNQTLSNFDILASPIHNKIFLWYFASKGRPNSILINRFFDDSFFRFLGYYRSEGGKSRLSSRRGREFSFTNKNLNIISDFIKLFEKINSPDILKATISYNKSSGVNINEIKKELIRFGLDESNIHERKAERIKDFVIRLYVTNSLLSEVINNAENSLRKFITNNYKLDFIVQYLRGVIAGDGSFRSWRDKKGSLHSNLQIFEANGDALSDISKLLSHLGIHGNYKPAKTKMFIYTTYINWSGLLKLYQSELLGNKTGVLENVIKGHKRFRSLKHMTILPQNFSTSDFMKSSNKSYGYSATWLRDRQKEGFIEKTGQDHNQNIWKLTDNGESLASLLRIVKAN